MDSVSPDPTATPQAVRAHRRRWAWATIATTGLLSVSALLAVPAIADSTPSPSHDRVVVCDSGVETDGDIQISAATATRVAGGDTTPLPENCLMR
jgi:hypothetical protein